MENIRKYTSHAISILLLLNAILVFLLKGSAVVLFFGIMAVICGVAYLIEIFYTFVKMSDNEVTVDKKYITYPLIVLFGLYYIPCFNLRYIEDDENYKKKNIIFLVLTIVLTIALLFLMLNTNKLSNKLKSQYTNARQDVSIKLPEDFIDLEEGSNDFSYARSDYHVYATTIYGDRNIDKQMEAEIETIKENNIDAELISDEKRTDGNKTIRQAVVKGYQWKAPFIYVDTVIISSDKPGKMVRVYQYCLEKNYEDNKELMNKIVDSIKFE